jgi:hypothetical protein
MRAWPMKIWMHGSIKAAIVNCSVLLCGMF